MLSKAGKRMLAVMGVYDNNCHALGMHNVRQNASRIAESREATLVENQLPKWESMKRLSKACKCSTYNVEL